MTEKFIEPFKTRSIRSDIRKGCNPLTWAGRALVEFIAVPILKRKCNLRACSCCRRGGARTPYQSVKKDETKWPIPTWMTETKIPPAGNEVTVPVRRRDELSLGETRPWISFFFLFSFFPFRSRRNRYHFLFSSFSLLFSRFLFPLL